MTLPTILELTEDDVLVRDADRVFRRADAESPAIPAGAGGHVLLLAVTALSAPNESQVAALESAVEALSGVERALAMVGPARVPIDRCPADCTVHLHVSAGYRFRRLVADEPQ